MNEKDVKALAAEVHQFRQEEEYWWIGLPEWKSIENIPEDSGGLCLTLRGYLNDNYDWIPMKSDEIQEEASCCEGIKPGAEAQEHCLTLEHIETMIRENYPDIDANKEIGITQSTRLVELL